MGVKAQIHETAIVDEGAELGARTKVWHFCHVSGGARIGDDCSLGQNCFVDRGVDIGNNVRIQNNVSIYRGVHVADHVFLGPSCVLTNVVTPRSAFPRNKPERDYKDTWIEEGASVGANATIRCGVTLGEWCLVGSGAVVTRNVAPHAVVVGLPAKRVAWACHCGGQLKQESETNPGALTCPEEDCRRGYTESPNIDGELRLSLTNQPQDARMPVEPIPDSLMQADKPTRASA